MKDKKAQMDISMIIYVFIAVIVGLILFQTIAQQSWYNYRHNRDS